MSIKTKRNSNNPNNNSGLISEFLQQSSFLKSSTDQKKQFISQVRTSRQILYIRPQIQNGSYKMLQTNQTQLFQSFGNIGKNDFQKKQKINTLQNESLKQSFTKSQIDDTTYQSLMNQFMGSYLQERLQHQQQKYFNKKYGMTQQTVKNHPNSFSQPLTSHNYVSSLTNKDDGQSQINKKESQITFSGSKQSRIIDQMQESRIVKQQYFLLDQLKKSKKQNTLQSPQEKKQKNAQKKSQNLIEESYRLHSPTSSKKISRTKEKSIENSSQKSKSKFINSSNGKTKVQQINLVKEMTNKNLFKKPHQKYTISKTTHQKGTSKNQHKNSSSNEKKLLEKQPKLSSKKQNLQNQWANKSFEGSTKKQDLNFHKNKESFQKQNINKRLSLNKSLNSMKTFHLSSNKAQNLSRIQKINSVKQKQQIKSLKNQEPLRISINLHKRIQSQQLMQKEKQDYKSQNHFIKQSPNKYVYEYSYKMDQSPLKYSNQYNQKITPKSKPKQMQIKQQKSSQKNSTQTTQFKKDRQMIREIKKDLTKLIQKITIAKI